MVNKHLPDLGRHVEQQRHDRRVVVAVDDESHLHELLPEVAGVSCQLVYPSHA